MSMRLLCFLLVFPGGLQAAPNVLWIIADDHAAYVMGAYGNKIVRTPHLDQLAQSSMRFDRAYCNSPVCTASRQSFLTGLYPRTLGVTQLSTPLPEEAPSLAKLFSQAGYRTAAMGKMHFNSQRKHGFDLRLDQPDFQKWLKNRPRSPLPPDVAVLPPWKPFATPAREWLNAEMRPVGAVDAEMPDTWLAMQAAEYLQQKSDRPFFLMVSFYQPHSPFHFPVEYRGRIDPKQLPEYKAGAQDADQIPVIFRELNPAEKRGIAGSHYTSVEHLDKNVGIVLEALQKSPHDRDTLVIYIGDHGYMLGQHGRFEKHCMYEEAIRVPLLIRIPGGPKGSSSALVELLDLAPTLIDYCQLKPLCKLPGKSLRANLEQQSKQHREHVFIEYSENEEACVLTERWKLIYGSGQRERQDGYVTHQPKPGRSIRLYDRVNDPGEMTNLSEQPEQKDRVAHLLTRLREHLVSTVREPISLPSDANLMQEIDLLVQPRDVPGGKAKAKKK